MSKGVSEGVRECVKNEEERRPREQQEDKKRK
jgi:hypothetical protein